MRSNRPVKILFNDPNHYTIELENDRVRVLRIRYGPGEKSVPQTVAVFLNPAQCRFTYPDGRTGEGIVTASQVMSFDALEHLPENTGDQAFEVMAIERKNWRLLAPSVLLSA